MEILDTCKIDNKSEYLRRIINNKEYNKVIIKYYEQYSQESSGLNFSSNIESLDNCNSWWLMDYYREQGVKDFKKTNLCKDKFCNNCKKVKQASRLANFMPHIEELQSNHYLYHLVLTVPNCSGTELKDVIRNKVFASFKRLNRYLNLDLKIKGLDFAQYGYKGAIRSLEVTFNNDNYHPHLHCIIALDSPIDNNRYIRNTYSKSRKNGYRKFTDFEILIQKIWYLLNNDIKVTKRAIENLELGYSCTLDPIDEKSVFEVFKYMTKSTDEKSNVLTYGNFKTLYDSLYKVRQMQGYGCFYNFKDDDSIIDEVDDLFDTVIEMLKLKEDPIEVWQTPEDLLAERDKVTIISRKKVFSYMRKLLLD